MNGVTMEVPKSNANVTQNTTLYSTYNDTKNNVYAFVYDSTNAGLNDLTQAMEVTALEKVFQTNSTQQTADGITYNYSQSTGVYTHVTNFTHKNVLVVTKDKQKLIHIVKSLKVQNNTTLNQTNSTNQTTTKPTTTTKKKSTTTAKKVEREEDKITADGWNPKEHEVSREKLDNNLERVYYDDGYKRVVDKKGNIKSYGF